ncbi:transcription factor hamlet [Teleopsis dalmanni]|uniref:transcription factor hamlet n=1 Tax=Teleopsis dalmanni TaxID=139649 RepID=UPI0018CE5879|nr:transcription factor hamlet [Teleopsis dalmanni]
MIFDRYGVSGNSSEEYEHGIERLDVGKYVQTVPHLVPPVPHLQILNCSRYQQKHHQQQEHQQQQYPPNCYNILDMQNLSDSQTCEKSPQRSPYNVSSPPPTAATAAAAINLQSHQYSQIHQLLNSRRMHAERFLSEISRARESICDLDVQESGVFARVLLQKGTRYGPFPIKFCTEPLDRNFAYEVIANTNSQGWLEPSAEVSNWTRKIRLVSKNEEANVKSLILSGYLFYETTQILNAGEELKFDPSCKAPLHVSEGFLNGNFSLPLTGENANEREKGVIYNGNTTGDEDFSKEKVPANQSENNLSDDENGFDIRCEVCDKTFADIELLDDHLVAVHHFRKNEFSCELCAKLYCHRPLLLKHRALDHNDVRKYPCENCTKVFCDPSNLQRHIRNRHIGARSHACHECGKTFATSSGLKQHTHIHSSVKPFQCEVCFKAYTQFSNLCRHKRMHADCRMQIKCNKCGQSFSTVTSLSKHKRFCDSTSIVTTPVGIASGLAQQLSPQVTQPRVSVPGANASNPTMAAPPNPFFLFRSPTPFFPGFPGAYGLQGMFAQSQAAHNSNFPLIFPKPNLDLRMPTANQCNSEEPKFAANCTNLNNLDLNQHINFDTLRHSLPTKVNYQQGTRTNSCNKNHNYLEINASDVYSTSCPTPKNRNSFLPSDEDSNSSSFALKSPPSESMFEGITNGAKYEKRNSEDDKKSIDIINTPPPVESNLQQSSSTELPLDLSVNKKQKRKENSDIMLEKLSKKIKTANESEKGSYERENDNNSEHKVQQESNPDLDADQSNISAKSPSEINSVCLSFYKNSVPSVSPCPTPSPSPPSNDLQSGNGESLPAMACPQPIHPMFLDEIYRTNALAAFQRPFNFLGSMSGRSCFERTSNLAVHTNGNEHFPPEHTFREALRATSLSSRVLQATTGKIKDRYTCKFCGKMFPRSANLTRHLRTHTGEQPYTCKYCDRAFSISSNLQRHVRNIHNKERPFRCHLCDRCFGQQTNLDRHLKKHEVDTTGLGLNIGDSPSSNEADREESYFDEIRTFMGQVTYNENLYTPTSIPGAENDTDYAGSDAENDISISRSSSADVILSESKETIAKQSDKSIRTLS